MTKNESRQFVAQSLAYAFGRPFQPKPLSNKFKTRLYTLKRDGVVQKDLTFAQAKQLLNENGLNCKDDNEYVSLLKQNESVSLRNGHTIQQILKGEQIEFDGEENEPEILPLDLSTMN